MYTDVKAIRSAANRHLKRPYLSNFQGITAPSTQWVLSSNILNSWMFYYKRRGVCEKNAMPFVRARRSSRTLTACTGLFGFSEKCVSPLLRPFNAIAKDIRMYYEGVTQTLYVLYPILRRRYLYLLHLFLWRLETTHRKISSLVSFSLVYLIMFTKP